MKPKGISGHDFGPELRTYEKIFAGVCGYGIRCFPITDEDELGYTTPDRTIHLAYWHEIMTGISAEKAIVFRQGVFVHEMLHQIFTDFKAEEKFLEEKNISLNYGERNIFHNIVNILEDPAIEYFAPQEIGSRLLRSLRFMIAWVWKKSKSIETTRDPFGQFVNAFIQIGDMGYIKGHFTDPAAKKAYHKALPSFNAGVIEPDPAKRVIYAYEIFEASRPLWEERMEEMENLLKLLSNIMEAAGKVVASSTEQGERNGILIIPEPGISDQAGEEKRQSRKKSAEDGIEDPPDSFASQADDEPDENRCDKYDVSGADVESIVNDIRENSQKEKKEEYKKEREADNSAIPEFDLKGNFGEVKCVNNRITTASAIPDCTDYEEIVSRHKVMIHSCVKYLTELFRDSIDDTVRHTSGKYNIIRAETSSSVRIFDKRRVPDNSRPAIMLLVDKSGSTRGNKIAIERETAITLAEIFGQLDIPLYVMAFYSDLGAQVIHEHYITWKNNRTTRQSLIKLNSGGCNMDGYSIRYAGKILQKRPEEKKILFILSDGEPSCPAYESRSAGIKDTTDAIREVRKDCKVCGFGIGSKLENLQEMYGSGFITVDDVDSLPSVLIKKLKQIL